MNYDKHTQDQFLYEYYKSYYKNAESLCKSLLEAGVQENQQIKFEINFLSSSLENLKTLASKLRKDYKFKLDGILNKEGLHFLEMTSNYITFSLGNIRALILDLLLTGLPFDCFLDGLGSLIPSKKTFIDSQPDLEKDYIQKAVFLFKKNLFGLAHIEFSNAILCNDKNFYSYYCRGICKQQLQDSTEAVTDYSKALELKINDFIILQNRGAAYDEIGDFVRAIKDYNKAIELATKNDDIASLYANRGNTNFKMGNFEKAKEDWLKAQELGEEDIDYRFEMLPKD